MSQSKGILNLNQTKEDVQLIAEDLSCEAFFAQDNELFIDLDDNTSINYDVLNILESVLAEDIFQLTTLSRNRQGSHVYIRLNTSLPEGVRIALQAALGSDPKHEALSAIQSSCGREACVALFEKPAEALRVKKWRSRVSFDTTIELVF